MANYQFPYSSQFNQITNQLGQLQQMFPQPQGSVYSINSPLDIGNVPIGSTGLSVAICLPEELMYIKSFQNGSPVIMTYHITPHNNDNKLDASTSKAPEVPQTPIPPANTLTDEQIKKIEQIDAIQEKLAKLESVIL